MRISFLIGLLLTLASSGVLAQQASAYFAKASPAELAIESFLDQGAVDSVRLRCLAFLDTNGEALNNESGRRYFYLGQAAFQEGDFEESGRNLEEALAIFTTENNAEGIAVAKTELGMLAYANDRKVISDTFFDDALRLASELDLHRVLFRIYFHKALDPMEEVAHVIPYLHRSLSLAEKLNDDEKRREVYEQLANQHRRGEQIDSSIYYFNRVLDIHQEQQDSVGMYDDYSTLGGLYCELGDYTKAQTYLFSALNLAENGGNDFSRMSLYTRIAEVYLNLKNWDKAQEYSELALQLARNVGIKRTEADNLRMQGYIFRQQEDTTAAIQKYQAALDIYQVLNTPLELAEVLIELGSFYQDNANYLEARPLLEDALAIRKRMDNPLEILRFQLLIGKLDLVQGESQQAIDLLTECVAIGLEKNSREDLKMAYALLAEAYHQNGQHQLAYESYRNYHTIDTSLLATENASRVHEIDEKYQNAQLLIENAQYEVTTVRQQSQIRLLGIGLAAVFLLVVLVLFIYFKNRQLHRQKIRLLSVEKDAESLRSMMEGEEKERRRIGRELHDGLGAVLATVKMQINALQRYRPELEELSSYKKAEQLIDSACSNVREISHNLMPAVLEQQGLDFALDDLCKTVARSTGLDISYIPFGIDRLDQEETNIAVYRMVQELLKNIVKHARASEVIIQLTVEGDQINLVVEDDGVGFDVEAVSGRSGIGLNNVRTRVDYLNGQLTIDSRVGEGSTFSIDVPLHRNHDIKP